MEKIHSRRFIVGFLIVAVCVILLLSAFMSWHEMRIKRIDIRDYGFAAPSIVYSNMDEIKTESVADEHILSLSGWCVIKKFQTCPIEMHVVLHDPKSDEAYVLPTTVVKRHDVTEFFSDAVNYDYSGFKTKLSYDSSDFPGGIYNIYLLYKVEEQTVLVDLQRVVAI